MLGKIKVLFDLVDRFHVSSAKISSSDKIIVGSWKCKNYSYKQSSDEIRPVRKNLFLEFL